MSDEENRLLRARLATADNQIERLKQRELELMAQVERLRHGHKAWAKMSDQTYRAGMTSLLEETPQQSLAHIQADAVESFINELESFNTMREANGYEPYTPDEYAQQLREADK